MTSIVKPPFVGKVKYTLRDNFVDTRAAGAVNGTPATPGPGNRLVVETDGQWSIGSNELTHSAQASAAYGDLVFKYAEPITRSAGVAFRWYWKVANVTSNGPLMGVSNALPVTANSIYGLLSSLALVYVRLGASNLTTVMPNASANTYIENLMILRNTGFFMASYDTNTYTLRWVDNTFTTATVYPCFAPYNTISTYKALWLRKLSGSWGSDFGICTTYIASPVAGNTGTQRADALVEFTWTPVAGETFELSVRMTDADNRWIVRCDQAGSTIKLIERNATVETERATAAQTFTAGTAYRIVAIMDTNSISAAVALTYKFGYASATFNNTATGMQVAGFTTGANWAAYPRRFATLAGPFDSSSDAPMAGYLNLFEPQNYQTFQRSGATGTIYIRGIFNQTGAHDVEASFNGGAYVTIASGVASGADFSGTLTGQAQGQGTLTVRLVDATSVNAAVALVGIGDVFIVAGQSNAMGYGTNNQSYSHASLKAAMLGNDYHWKDMLDPTDSGVGQIDSVSDDSGVPPRGSYWPLIATSHMADQSVPMAIIQCAKGSTSIAAWQPGADHQDRTTLYGSMVYRALAAHGVKAVLWHQGESDFAMTQAAYNASLDALANAIASDLGIKLMPCKLQDCAGDESRVNAAIGEAWADNANVLTGPDLSGITTAPEDSNHLITDAKLASAAGLWWTAIETAFGW